MRRLSLVTWVVVPAFFCSLFVFQPRFWGRMDASIAGGVVDELSFVWIFHRLSDNLLHHRDRILDGRILYPETKSLILSETVVLSSLVYRSLFSLFGNKILSYNLTLLLFFLANYYCMYFFCRLFLKPLGACVAGTIFAFSLVRLAHLQHIHVMPQFLFPVCAYSLFMYETKCRIGWVIATAIALSLQFYFSMTLGMILLITLLPYVLLRSVGYARRFHLPRLFLGGALFALLTLPLSYSYFKVSHEKGLERSIKEAGVFSANLKSFFVVPKEHPYAGWLVDGIFGGEHGQRQEKNLFVGFAVLLLACLGAGAFWGSRYPPQLAWRSIVFVVFAFVIVLAMGRNAGLYTLFYHAFPGIKGIRTPARFGLSYLFFMALFAGIGIQVLRERLQKRKVYYCLLGLLFGLFVLDNYLPVRFTEIPKRLQSSTWFLSKKIDTRAVFYLPLTDALDALRMYESLDHTHPLVNGYAGFRPETFGEFRDLADGWFLRGKAENKEELKRKGVRYLVLEKEPLQQMGLIHWLVEARRADQTVFENDEVLILDFQKDLTLIAG